MSSLLDVVRYMSFWNTHLNTIPRSYIDLHYEQFLPPRVEAFIHRRLTRELTKKFNPRSIGRPTFLFIYNYISNLKIHTQHTNFTRLQKLEHFITKQADKDLNDSKLLNINDYVEFWGHRLGLDYYTHIKYTKFIPAKIKNFIRNISALNVSADEEKTFVHLITHFHNLDYHEVSRDAFDDIAPWAWLLKTLLTKVQRLKLHPLSDVKIDLAFETLLARVLSDESSTLNRSLDGNVDNDWPKKMVQLFDSTILDNVDYFIRHNNILILKAIAEHIFERDTNTLRPDAQLKILEKIISHELSLDAQDLYSNYDISYEDSALFINEGHYFVDTNRKAYRGGNKNSTKLVSYTNRVFEISNASKPAHTGHDVYINGSLLSFSFDKLVSEDFLFFLKYDTLDIKGWSLIDGVERLVKMIYHNTHPYEHNILHALMHRHWAQHDWALDFIEHMIDEEIENFDPNKQASKDRGDSYARIADTFLSKGLPEFFGNNRTRHNDNFSHPYRRITQMLEKIILFIGKGASWDDDIAKALGLQNLIQHHFAGVYFNGDHNFSIPQLRQRIQMQHQKPSCTNLLAQKTS